MGRLARLDSHWVLAEFNGLEVCDYNLDNFARDLSCRLIHQLHRFNDTDGFACLEAQLLEALFDEEPVFSHELMDSGIIQRASPLKL